MFRERFVYPLLIFSLAAALYWPSLDDPFQFDDDIFMRDQNIQHGRWKATLWPPAPRTLTWLTFLAQYQGSGRSPTGYHGVNVGLHGAVSVVVFFLLLFICRLSIGSSAASRIRAPEPALIGALVFALHPLQSESVFYVYQRSTLLATLFAFLAMLSWLHTSGGRLSRSLARISHTQSTAEPESSALTALPALGLLDVVHDYASGGLGRNALSARRFRLFATTGREKSGLGGGLTLLFFLLAIASKEFVIVLPFLLWVMDGVWRGRWKPDRLLAGPFFISLVAMAGFFAWVKTSGEQTLGGSVVESLHYAKAQVEVIWFYAGLALVPRHLNIDHHIVLSSAAFDPVWWLALAGLVLLSWCLYRLSRGHQAAALAAFIFLAFLAPTSSFFPSQDLMFEHRVYASMLGFAFGIALVFQVLLRKGMALADRFSLGGSPAHSARLKLVLTLPFLGLLTLYAFLTLQRSSVWSSPLSLWRDAVSKSEGKYRPNLNLGVLLMAENDKQAEIYLSRAIEIDPSNPLAYRSLGRLYFEQDRVKAAESLWRQAVLLDPLHSKTHTALGKLYADRLNFINATRSLEEAIRLSPRDWEPHFYLAQLDLRFGLVVKAIHQSELGLQHAPDHTGLRFLLADAVSQQHNWQRAIELYQEGLRKDPQNARAYYGLGRAHWKAGERDSALESIRKGLAVAQSPAEIALGKKLLKRISP